MTEVLLLTYSLTLRAHNKDADDVRRSYYVFDDLQDALFMVSSPTSLCQLRISTLSRSGPRY